MPVSVKTRQSLAEIFESPSDEEDFDGFRASLPMDTSSEDSRDSLQSLDQEKTDPCFRSKYITEELLKIFTEDTDTEEEEFEGFTEAGLELNDWMKSMSMDSDESSEEDTGFCSDGEPEAPVRRRSSGLCVAFRFPTKKSQPAKQPERERKPESSRTDGRGRRGKAQQADAWSESEEEQGRGGGLSVALQKRANNIKENKEMLAKLLAEFNSMPELLPMKTPAKKKKSPKKPVSEGQSGRRNPTRSARPPEHFAVEISPSKIMEQLQGMRKRAKIRKRLLRVNEDVDGGDPPRRKHAKRRESRAVEDITEDDLENVAYTSKDKIYDNVHGSTCHQCRQKTIDTKTECRNPNCWGVRGQFCGPCLRNRYGEDVREALLDPMWVCPPCRGICNCSFCRKRDGHCATGILIHMAKFYGHDNVREYLESLKKHLGDED